MINEKETPRKRILLFKVAGSLCLLALISYKLDFHLLYETLKSAETAYIFYAILAAFAFIMLHVIKWHGLLSVSYTGLRFHRVFISYCFGLGVGILTPGRIGEITRIHNLGLEQKAKASGLFLLDKFIDLAVVFGMALYGIYFLFPQQVNIFILTMFIGGVVMILFSLRRAHSFFGADKMKRFPYSDKFQQLFKAISEVPRPKIILNGLLTFLSYVICVYEKFFLLNAFTKIKLGDVLLIHPIVMMTNVVPFTVGGLGLREGTSVLLYTEKGLAAEHAFLGGFLIFVLNTFFYGMLGVVFVNFFRKDKDL